MNGQQVELTEIINLLTVHGAFQTVQDKISDYDHFIAPREEKVLHPLEHRMEHRWYYIPRNTTTKSEYPTVDRLLSKAELLFALETTKPNGATCFWVSDEKRIPEGHIPTDLKNPAGDGTAFWTREYIEPPNTDVNGRRMKAYRIVFFNMPVQSYK